MSSLERLPSKQEIRQEKARRHLADWCRYVDDQYEVAPHHAKLIAALERVERGECKRLIVSMPPRMGKSMTTSWRFPAWFIGRDPDRQVLLGSYSASLAEDMSRTCRNELGEYGPEVFGVGVSDGSSAVDRWAIEGHRGKFGAAGVGGSFTGKGADLFIIDDPLKGEEEANSELMRQRAERWYRTTVRSRLAPGGRIVLVMTRWHEDDLAGALLTRAKQGGIQWEELRLPMLDDDGAQLWPGRFSDEEIADLKIAAGTRGWEAVYQQRPAPAEGGLLKRPWWKYYREAPRFDSVLQSWDMAFKDTKGSDFVVGQVWGKKGASCYLLDQVRGRMNFPATCVALEALSLKWPEATLKLVEDKANGSAVIDSLKERIPGLVAVEPDGGKEARAAAVSPLIEAGNVFLPDPKLPENAWVEEFLLEATSFPYGRNDDQVDAATQALNRMRGQAEVVATISAPKPRPRGVTQ